jgi:hypothetical protein
MRSTNLSAASTFLFGNLVLPGFWANTSGVASPHRDTINRPIHTYKKTIFFVCSFVKDLFYFVKYLFNFVKYLKYLSSSYWTTTQYLFSFVKCQERVLE